MARPKSASPEDCTATLGFETFRRIEADIGNEHADTFRRVQHPDSSAGTVFATRLRSRQATGIDQKLYTTRRHL